MKKLMFAAALMAAGAAMAVESQIVGYMVKDLRGGMELSTPTFQVVGGARGAWLSDLIPIGYKNNETKMWEGAVSFFVTIRDDAGATAVDETGKELRFTWTESFDVGTWEEETGGDPSQAAPYWGNDGMWTGGDGEPVVAHTEGSDLWIPAGTGIWIQAPEKSAYDAGAKYTFTYSGEVNKNDCPIVFQGGKNPCGNMFPVGIRLSSLIPTGYLNNETKMWEGAVSFSVDILGYDGATETDNKGVEKKYTYSQSFDVGTWEEETGGDPSQAAPYWIDDAKWTDGNGDDVIVGGANDPVFAAGQGLWIQSPANSAYDPEAEYSVTFRYPAK